MPLEAPEVAHKGEDDPNEKAVIEPMKLYRLAEVCTNGSSSSSSSNSH